MNASIAGRAMLRLACASAVALAAAGVGSTGNPRAVEGCRPGGAEARRRLHRQRSRPRRRIRGFLTELVDHMPASDKVPSPLKFLGYVPGEPGQHDVPQGHRPILDALEKASPRVKMFRIGKSEEGRDMVALAIADEATIKQLDKYKQITAQLTDPRKLPRRRPGSSSRPASRSTTPPAASIRRRPAAPRC